MKITRTNMKIIRRNSISSAFNAEHFMKIK